MSDVPSLTDLYNAFRERNRVNGRPLPHREAAVRAGDPGKYETFRLIGVGKHKGNLDEDTVTALVRLGLNERDVRQSAGHQVERVQGPFVLPSKANRLTGAQREVVLSVVETILAAGENAIAQERRRKDRAPLRAVAAGQRSPEAQQEASDKARRRRRQMEKDE